MGPAIRGGWVRLVLGGVFSAWAFSVSGAEAQPVSSAPSLYGGDQSVPEAYSLAHLPSLEADAKPVVEVVVQAMDGDGNPAEGRFFCYNQDLGLSYPGLGASRKLESGRLVAHLPRGRYAMIAWNPNLFLARSVAIGSSCTVTLRGDSTLRVRAWDVAGQPLQNAEIAVLDSTMKPLLPWFGLATKSFQEGPATLGVCAGSLLDLVIAERVPPGQANRDCYLLVQQAIHPGDEVAIRARREQLARIDFDILDRRHGHCPGATLQVSYPALTLASGIRFFRDENVDWDELKLWLTPGPALLGMSAFPPGEDDVYNFYPKTVGLMAGQAYRIRAGGIMKPAVWFLPSGDSKHIWAVEHDEFGGGITNMGRSDPAMYPTLRLKDDTGNVVHTELLCGTFDKILQADPTGNRYELAVNLGPFGDYFLQGRAHAPDNELPVTRRETKHLVVEFPDMFADRYAGFARIAETGYATIAEIVGSETASPPHYMVSLFGPGWCSGLAFGCHVNYYMDPRSLSYYPDDYFKGAFNHELAHVFQGSCKGIEGFGTPNGPFAEAMASHFSALANERIIGRKPIRYAVLAHRENFFRTFYKTQGCLDELEVETVADRYEPYWRYFFILSHLNDVFGREIHKRFIHLYAEPANQQVWQPVVEREGLTSDETLCAMYSQACNQDLCGLFQMGDFPVSPLKVKALRQTLESLSTAP